MLRISLLHQEVSNVQGGESESEKDREPDHDTEVVDCHDFGKGWGRRCAVRAPSCLFVRLGEVSGRIRQASNTTCNVLVLIWTGKADGERDSG